MTTADVVSSWTSGAVAGGLRSQVSRHVQAIVPVDERSLAITLLSERRTCRWCSQMLASRSPGAHPVRNGRSARALRKSRRIRQGPTPAAARSSRLPGVAAGSTSLDTREDPWSVRFLVAPGRDPRDFLDEGVDLLLTRNRATIDYANTLPQFMSVAMAWQRTHVFVSRQRGRTMASAVGRGSRDAGPGGRSRRGAWRRGPVLVAVIGLRAS